MTPDDTPDYPTILTIDDEAIIRYSFKAFLEDQQFNVLEAEDGVIGLELFAQHTPDLVLLDLNMPEMDGLTVLEKMRDLSQETPIVVISGTGELTDIAQALRLGAWDYLFKPIQDLSVLLHSIQKVLERARLIKENKQYQLNLEQKVQERTLELKQSEKRYRSLVANIPVGLYRYTPGTTSSFITANPAASKILGYDNVDELLASNPDDIYVNDHDGGELLEQLLTFGEVLGKELQIKHQNGSHTWAAVTAHVVKNDDGTVQHIDTMIEDISKRREAEEQIKHLAYYDRLTDLPNRTLLLYQLRGAIKECIKNGTQGGIIFVDLDRFKMINDSLGHITGDIFLQRVARRLTTLLNEDETVARIGGDEFAVLFSSIHTSSKDARHILQAIAENIRKELARAIHIGNHELYITASLGIALYPEGADNAEEVLKHASTAVSRLKKTERNKSIFYQPDMQDAATQRLEIEKELRGAIDRDELQLYYQPQVDGTGTIFGTEALIRWEHPQRGIVSPGDFIPVAEETGLILSIGEWVILTACMQLKQWQEQNIGDALRHVSVNVSPWQFRQPDFAEIVNRTIGRSGVDPAKITIEITEGVALNNLEDTIGKMLALKQQGIRFSIDDFGTGYSSLSYLDRLPLDQLKIDRSFIQGITDNSSFASIVSTIIVMADSMGFDVVAEGVETISELNFLLEKNCDAFQGFYFSKPLPASDFATLLREQQGKT